MTPTLKKPAIRPAKKVSTELVPLSTEVPKYVRDHLDRSARPLGNRASLARLILTNWSEDNKHTR